MRKLKRLLELLESHPMRQEGIRLKALIENHPQWIRQYQAMLALQKRLVRQTVDNEKQAAATKREIDQMLAELEAIPAVAMYLDTLAQLQEDFDAVAQIMNQELNRQ